MQMDLMAMDKGKGKPVFLQALTRDKVRLYNWGGREGALESCKEDFGGMGVLAFFHFVFLGGNNKPR